MTTDSDTRPLDFRIADDEVGLSAVPGAPENTDFPGAIGWTVTLYFLCDLGPLGEALRDGLTVPFYMGSGGGDALPTAEGVLSCLLSDAATVASAESFEEWCAELGLDTDSRKAFATYEKTREQSARLLDWLGDRADAYLYQTQF